MFLLFVCIYIGIFCAYVHLVAIYVSIHLCKAAFLKMVISPKH